ncbi:hypothetical protein HZ993_00920 [Rhodoferax sp. AJA081-3]|uniref:beta strand repeat-containing protein n=1 Tax=Rhodoferax sp. AJA081-3 TaxID=2752316 RepID=UPI001AE0AB1A|nr:hypothetical protein [Rhodoferax sp. AJA081-3]QTN28455.1 hypothetical protein HZ993_00920 [Rhodoferax sp. AJA081-3]
MLVFDLAVDQLLITVQNFCSDGANFFLLIAGGRGGVYGIRETTKYLLQLCGGLSLMPLVLFNARQRAHRRLLRMIPVLSALVAGVLFSSSAAAQATAANSTVDVLSNVLNVGATTTATLTLKDAGGVALGDVSGSGATITSDSINCTVGVITRSATDGTVTASITGAGAGFCMIGGTLEGSTPVTATQAVTVTAVATAGNSTVDVLSNTLNGVGATTTATLTLRDSGNAPLGDVSGSGATITSNSGNCTVGSFTRSMVNGTVTATITAASAGSCTIGGTLDGTTPVIATQAVTVTAVATAANSTLVVGSNTLNGVGATTTATLTLRDSGNTALVDVSGSGATITSNSANCTVGSFTRSMVNGTVTATITAASAGSCTIGATLDGTAAVTATQAVTVTTVATAANSTLTVGSNSLSGVGATTTATLTLRDSSNAALGNVLASGATITSNSGNCTVGSITRSSFNGTVTATITAASAGTCTIGGTLDGTAAVTATQTVTVTVSITISGGSGTIPSGGSGTITGPSTVTVGTGSTVDVSSSNAGGSTLTLSGNSSGVSVNLGGGSSLGISTGSTGATLSVSASGSGNALLVTQGSATLTGSAGGLVLQGTSGQNVVTGSSGATIVVTGNSGSGGSTQVTVQSGTVTAPRNCGVRPTLPSTPPSGSKSSVWNTYFASVSSYQRNLLAFSLCIAQADQSVDGLRVVPLATPLSMVLYRGESITYDVNGVVTDTSLVDGGAGVAQNLTLPIGFSLESVPVSIDGTPARLNGANLGSSVVNALQTLLGTTPTRLSNSSIGGIVTSLTDGTVITGVPIGQLQVSSRDNSELQSNGLARVVTNGVVVNLAPTVANPDAMVSQIKGLDAQATVTVMASGLLKATVSGVQYFFRPSWTATPSTASGFSPDAAGNLVFGDSKLKQTLYPAFADPNKVIAVLSTISGAGSPVQEADGTISVAVGNQTLTLRPGYNLISRPVADTDVLWWVDGGVYYVNYLDGTAQSFTVK